MEVNPLNVDAFIALSQDALGRAATADEVDGLLAISARLLAQTPGDARLYSARGGLKALKGETQEALSDFRHALVLAPTELYALRWMIRRSAEQGDKSGFVNFLDTLFRRWPGNIDAYAPFLPEILQTSEERLILVRHLQRQPPWRPALINRLSASPGGALFAAELLWELSEGTSGPTDGEINQVVGALLDAGQYDEAYQTFLVTLAPDKQMLSGNVYNGGFSAAPSGAPFDWAVRRQPGLTVTLPKSDGGKDSSSLSLEFLQTPVRDPGIRQFLKLAPGSYRLSVQASGDAAVLPKRLFWSVSCFRPSLPLARLAVAQGTYPMTGSSVTFAVPEDRCGLQVLRLENRAMTESWNDRYSGTIAFDEIRIVSAR